MKYYFPTSTLNFDAIYSSMSIMPSSFYRDEAIWFSRYFKTSVDVADDVIVLYSRPVKWEVLDEGSVDYPMLVEMDSSIVESLLHDTAHCGSVVLSKDLSCVYSNIPITFRTSDLLSGKIKIIFRNQQEQKTLEARARVGVAECKFAGALGILDVDIFSEGFPVDAIAFDSIKTEVSEAVENLGLKYSRANFEEYEHKDRERGAEAGFLAGKWIHSIQSGYCLDCFMGGFDYDSWKKLLPPEFASIIDMLCNKIGFRWDVNRSAIVDFCTECWKSCFNIREDMPVVEQWHVILQRIAKCHKDPTFNYPVRSITDRYMQALACFIGAGKRSNILAKSIRDDKVAMPELALALYGALVGFSVFQRIFFELRNFESLPPPPPPPLPPPQGPTKILPDWARRILDVARRILSQVNPKKKRDALDNSLLQALSECTNERELIQQLPEKHQKEGWGPRTNVFKELKKELEKKKALENELEKGIQGDLFSQQLNETVTQCPTLMEVGRGSDLLIDDSNLGNDLEVFLRTQTGFSEKERMRILEDAQYLQREYSPGGRYSRDEVKNPRDNVNTIRHFINLINIKMQLTEGKRDLLNSFLKQRYSLEGNNG